MTTYQDLDTDLHYSPNHLITPGERMDSRKVANHTWFQRDGHLIHVRFHQTNILTYHPDNRVTLNTGGWYTVSTKERMNRYLGWGTVHSERGDWYVSAKMRLPLEQTWHDPTFVEVRVPYENFMTLHAVTHELVSHPSDTIIDLGGWARHQVTDAVRFLDRERQHLRVLTHRGEITRSDLEFATLLLDKYRVQTKALADTLREIESGTDWAMHAMEDTLLAAIKEHAEKSLLVKETRREVRGQTRLDILG